MKKSKLFLVFGLVASLIAMTGCQVKSQGNEEDDPYAYLKELEKGCYYIRHANKKCEKVYFGNATFDDGTTVSRGDDGRIMWFKEDFSNIPTLYEGESLIYCTNEELEEQFNFERFEDLGYSIGMCGLTETVSGRYTVSTDTSDRNTYPGGDTDAILLLENENVIIDTLGGKELRTPVKTDRGVEGDNTLTRCRTITGLVKGTSYKAEIYEGTERHEYIFKADVKILGSMEVKETTNYKFESETIINIEIPKEFNSGYYMINGLGLFRYVKGNSYDANTDFNVPNQEKEENDGINSILPEAESKTDSETQIDIETPNDVVKNTFKIEKVGITTITVTLENTDNPASVTGIITTPDGKRFQMTRRNGALEVTIVATEVGEYTLELYDLNGAGATLTIQ